MTPTGSLLRSLECRACCTEVDPDRPTGTCPTCGSALFATYSLDSLDRSNWAEQLTHREATLWRYRELLPVRDGAHVVTLGEGFTPVLRLEGSPESAGLHVWLKDEGTMPTGSFKARGMAVAVSRARELGLGRLFVPSAGNAGVALAAYGARGGSGVRVYLPETTPTAMKDAIRSYGAELVTVPGTIRDAGEVARREERLTGAFDMSTLREPYRAEGKKTMGLEVWEQFRSTALPDAIVYPTGGGTGLVGMYRAFLQLRELGLLERMPRLYAVQSEGCAPVVRALREGAAKVTPWDQPHTVAPGLLVPTPFASERILEAVRGTSGGGATVTDEEVRSAVRALATRHGVSASPEGAAPWAALPHLLRDHALRPDETVLLFNTGSGIPFLSEGVDRSAARAS
jgi:threonine synthase